MKTVTAREANQSFSRLLSEVEAGEEITVTKRGKVIARILPASSPGASPVLSEQQKRAAERLVEIMDRGYRLGGKSATRDEMHER